MQPVPLRSFDRPPRTYLTTLTLFSHELQLECGTALACVGKRLQFAKYGLVKTGVLTRLFVCLFVCLLVGWLAGWLSHTGEDQPRQRHRPRWYQPNQSVDYTALRPRV
jgi:hypothetical protein